MTHIRIQCPYCQTQYIARRKVTVEEIETDEDDPVLPDGPTIVTTELWDCPTCGPFWVSVLYTVNRLGDYGTFVNGVFKLVATEEVDG